mgnify:CR=1 FL=1
MKLRTIHIISPTESVITERGQRHPNLASYLLESGEQVNYVTSTINHASKRLFTQDEICNAKKLVKYPITFLDCGLYKKNISIKRLFWNLLFALKVFLLLRKACEKGDIIIFPSRPPELLYVAKLLKKMKKIKLLIDVEDIWPDAFLVNNKLIKACFYTYCNLINRSSIPSFDRGVHVSPNFKTWLEKYSPNFDSVFTPLGINSSELLPGSRKVYSSSIKALRLFYGGTLTLQFDILPVLKAINMSDVDISISLAGDNGSGERYKEIMDYVEQNKINCVNHGLMGKGAFLDELGKSDIVIIPMISGGLPKKFYDAVGSYKPILCLGSGGVAEAVESHGLGWVVAFNENEILNVFNKVSAESLNEVITNIEKHVNEYLESNSLKLIYSELVKLKSCNN